MKSPRWFISYIFVTSIGILAAFAVSSYFMMPARSQEAPSSGDLPPEFLKEIESTQVPATQPNVPPAAPPAIPPPPVEVTPMAPPQREMAPVEMETVGPTQELLEASQGVNFIYDPTGKRDPFRPHRSAIKVIPKEGSGSSESADPLLKHDLDKLEVIGILWDVKKPRAVVRDPDGNTYSIVKNSKIGRADGFVAAIRDGEIVVIETVYVEGKTTREARVLELKK